MSDMPILDRDSAASFLDALERGTRRAARREDNGEWIVDRAVKESILTIFRISTPQSAQCGPFPFQDRDLLFPRQQVPEGVRVVPGGTAIRRGAFVAPGVVVMPPSYLNVGAYVDSGSMVDSHVLVGSCAQIGCRVHLSAGVQIGGVLEPIGALPVIIEDDVFVGGLSAIFEGVRIREQAVIAAGVVLTASKPIFDLVNERRITPENGVVTVPARAVVINGSRGLQTPFATEHRLGSEVALIVKYRDPKTDARLALEDLLR